LRVIFGSIYLARKTVKNADTIILSNDERNSFLALLENPPSPNEALKSAASRNHKYLHL
jgi:uncharacterized protein (DUF1778 family)